MLHLVAEGIESLLRAELAAGAASLDVAFDAPDREWAAKRSRPTVDCYLWDLGPNTDLAASGMEIVEIDGQAVRRPILPLLDLRYLVTAWTDDVRDEQQLLGGVTRALLRHAVIPAAHLPSAIEHLAPPILRLLPRQPEDRADFWNALGGRYRAGLDLLVSVQVDPHIRFVLPPAPVEVRLGVSDRRVPERSSRRWFGRHHDDDAVRVG